MLLLGRCASLPISSARPFVGTLAFPVKQQLLQQTVTCSTSRTLHSGIEASCSSSSSRSRSSSWSPAAPGPSSRHRHRHSRSAAVACSVVRQPEMCVIVDESNQVVGPATRKETVSKRLLGRGSYVLVFNSSGQLFVSQRSLSKDCYPGCLDVTISGVVNWGEEYLDTAVRELQEEVAIPGQQSRQLLQQLWIFPYQDSVCHVFGCAFKVVWDGPVEFADAEVEWGRFMSLTDLQQQLQQELERFTPVGRHILKLYLDWEQQQQQQ